MTPSTRRPNLEQVAAAAGVSRATVSRVVNGVATVDADLRTRVEKAIADLRYVPNQAARTLVTRTSTTSSDTCAARRSTVCSSSPSTPPTTPSPS